MGTVYTLPFGVFCFFRLPVFSYGQFGQNQGRRRASGIAKMPRKNLHKWYCFSYSRAYDNSDILWTGSAWARVVGESIRKKIF